MSWTRMVEAGRSTWRQITWPGLRGVRMEQIPINEEPRLEPVTPSTALLSENPFAPQEQARPPDWL